MCSNFNHYVICFATTSGIGIWLQRLFGLILFTPITLMPQGRGTAGLLYDYVNKCLRFVYPQVISIWKGKWLRKSRKCFMFWKVRLFYLEVNSIVVILSKLHVIVFGARNKQMLL